MLYCAFAALFIGQAYGIDAVNEFDPIFEDVYDYCEVSEIDVDTACNSGTTTRPMRHDAQVMVSPERSVRSGFWAITEIEYAIAAMKPPAS